jgi:hypothetical protein
MSRPERWFQLGRFTVMKISFSDEAVAQAAIRIFESYGYHAQLSGNDVVTDCPALLAAPVLEKTVGLDAIERLDIGRDFA